MSEERFDRLDARMGSVEADVGQLKADVSVLKTDVSVLKTDVSVLKHDVSILKQDVSVLKQDASVLKTDVGQLKADVSDLRRHMGVLHEEVVGRIKALGEDDSLRREMRDGFAELRQMFKDHIIVGDAADRRHAKTLDDHERRLSALEEDRS